MQTTFNFASLDISRTFDLKIGDINIPLLVHIRDIKENEGVAKTSKSEAIKYVDKKGSHIELYEEEPSEYETIREHLELKKSFKRYESFIDVDIPIFEFGTMAFLEYYQLDHLSELLEIFDRVDLQKLIDKCESMASEIMTEFFINIKDFLCNKEIAPTINIKSINDVNLRDIEKYANKPAGYLISQIGVEFPANVFFQENMGKAISEWSLRELQLQALYISEKNIVEGLFEKWKSKQNEENEKKNKSS